MTNHIGKILAAIIVMSLAACSTNTERDFLCEAQVGSPCTTISQADGNSQGSVTSVTERSSDTAQKQLSQGILTSGKLSAGFPDGGHGYDTRGYRVPEVTARLWIAPYLDENGILHESGFVHVLIREAKWAR